MMLLECTKCKTEFPETAEYFYKSTSGRPKKNGLSSWCKDCSKKQVRLAEIRRKSADPQKFTNKKRIQTRNQKLASYGLSEDQFNQMLEAQNYGCAVCGRKEVGRNGSENFIIDHCHTTGRVRGLLCHPCNVALGMVNDNISILEKMIEYVR